jgi:hypothetical protein
VLARLNQIDGVQSSSASLGNEGGALVLVSVRPGADAAKIAEEVQHVLRAEVKERPTVQLGERAAASAVQEKEWLDSGQLAEVAATEMPGSERRMPALLAALLLGCVVVGLGLLRWRYRGRGAAIEKSATAVGSPPRGSPGAQ